MNEKPKIKPFSSPLSILSEIPREKPPTSPITKLPTCPKHNLIATTKMIKLKKMKTLPSATPKAELKITTTLKAELKITSLTSPTRSLRKPPTIPTIILPTK